MAIESRSSPNPKYEEDLPTLPEVIEKVGFGPTHIRFIFSGGGVWLADGSELLLITSVTTSLATEWHLDPMSRGAMVTIVFVGVLVGNLICGPISDRHGRRQIILASYAGIFIFSVVSSLASSFLTLGFWRFFVGLSFGLGQPSWCALGAEVTPAKWRTFVNAVSQCLFTIGEIYSAMLIMFDDPNMENLHWRSLLRLGAIPSLIFGIASLAFLHQSPFFLAQYGQHDEASEVLTSMSRENGLPEAGPLRFRVAAVQTIASQGILGECRSIWSSSPLLISTLILMYTCFVLNFVAYGTLYAFPQILPSLHGSTAHFHQSAGMELLVGALWEMPGIALGCFFGMYFRRIPVLKLYCLLTASMLIMFAAAASGDRNTLAVILYHVGFYGIKCFVMVGFIVAYVYMCEVYPTAVRTTGTGIGIAAGRLAAMVAPLMFEKITEMSGTFSTFFYIAAFFCILNLLMVDFLPYETHGAALKEILEDVEVPSYGGVPEMSGSSHRL